MNDVKTVKLGDAFDLQMGKTPDRKKLEYFRTKDNKWISIADISKSEKYIFETKECISNEAVKATGIKIIPKNTLIMSFKLSIGKTAITTEDMYSNEAIMAFLPNGKYETDNSFLYHLFANKDWSEGSNRAVKGTTLNKVSLSNATINLPPLQTQKQIAARLDLCTDTIAKHKKLLELHETLIKSQFVKMFGDPKINSLNLPTKKFEDIVKLQRGFDLPVQNRNQSGKYFVYGSNGILDKHDEYKVKSPGIVTGRSGTLGKVYYIFEDYWPLNTTLFSADTYGNNVVYLKYLLEMFDLKRFTEGSGVPTLNRNIVHQKEIIDVPLALQQKFATFVQQVEKSKSAVQKSLQKAETLYKVLMQKYFGWRLRRFVLYYL